MKGTSPKTFLAVLLICHAVTTNAHSMMPVIKNIDGGISVSMAGFNAVASLGKFKTGNPFDKGLLVKIWRRGGPRAIAVLDGGNENGTLFGHMMAGAETTFHQGAAAGIGGKIGEDIQLGCFTISETEPDHPQLHKFGKYANKLMDLSEGFLAILNPSMNQI